MKCKYYYESEPCGLCTCDGDMPGRITDCGGYSIIDVRSACKEIEVCKHISSKEDCMGLLCPLYVPSKEPIIINRACPDSCTGNIPDRWRDVREELPDIAGSYIVFTVSGICKEIAWAFFNSDKRWVVNSSFIETVTHWQPLPLPPDGKE